MRTGRIGSARGRAALVVGSVVALVAFADIAGAVNPNSGTDDHRARR